MYHNDEDDAFASTMAAEGSQPEATPASSTLQLELSSDEAARAQCWRCKMNGSQSGKTHTCGKRRSTSPAATAVKRPRQKRNSMETAQPDPMSEDEDHSPLDVLSAATSVVQPATLAAADDVQEPTTCSDAARIEMLHMVRGWRCLTSDMLVLQECNITFPELTARISA